MFLIFIAIAAPRRRVNGSAFFYFLTKNFEGKTCFLAPFDSTRSLGGIIPKRKKAKRSDRDVGKVR